MRFDHFYTSTLIVSPTRLAQWKEVGDASVRVLVTFNFEGSNICNCSMITDRMYIYVYCHAAEMLQV